MLYYIPIDIKLHLEKKYVEIHLTNNTVKCQKIIYYLTLINSYNSIQRRKCCDWIDLTFLKYNLHNIMKKENNIIRNSLQIKYIIYMIHRNSY